MSSTSIPNLPRVAAVLVVHDGAEWLPSVLATLGGQQYPALELVVVDSASQDDSPALLERRIPADRLIRLGRNAGFGRAVAAALQHEAVSGADLILLLHDDLVLTPDAIARLAHALREDPALGIVGPKLRDWSEDDILQEVGMTIDHFGRAESQLEPGELDQGQHDRQREVLYVSTAGMMLRTDVLRSLGGFDARFPGFRDDLDLCWRAWLAGHRVAVVPAAVGYHIAAASRYARGFGRERAWHARELAERHTLATLLKNYGLMRLLWVLPIMALLAIGKTLGFLATRRFGDALAVVRAYGWNVLHLPRTLRRRRIVQSRRQVSDTDLAVLLAPGLPRVRAYAEAVGSWLAGGSTRALIEDEEEDELEPPGGSALWRSLKSHPAAWAGGLLLVAYLVGAGRLLGGGQLIGGEIAPWPASAREFLRAYASPWNGEPLGSGVFGSPIQALLGIVSVAGLGSAWLAQRLVVFGLLPLAWVLALRAGRLVTPAPAPRVLGATLYVLSPVVLGALANGRLGALVAAALLPGLLPLAARVLDPSALPGAVWRAAALLALGTGIGLAAEPAFAPLLIPPYLALLWSSARRPGRVGLRPVVVTGGAMTLLLSPWVFGLAASGATLPRAPQVSGLAFWRALSTAPPILAGLQGPWVWLVVAVVAAVVVMGVLLGMPAQPGAVLALTAVAIVSAALTWAVSLAEVRWIWAPVFLLPAALAYAGLGVIAAYHLTAGLRRHNFGLRQLAVVLAAVVAMIGVLGGTVRLASGPWHGLARDAHVAPAFVTADTPRVGPYRVLLLDMADGIVEWEVVRGDGPTMTQYGTLASPVLSAAIDDAVGMVIGGADLRGGARLGLLNIRYVVLVEGGTELRDVLMRQPALEPLPSGAGQVLRVHAWLPRAVLVPHAFAERLTTTGDPGDTSAFEMAGLPRLRASGYSGSVDVPDGGLLIVSEGRSEDWEGASTEGPLAQRPVGPVNGFEVPPGAAVVSARAGGGIGHGLVAVLQALFLLGIVSLALRPPGAALVRAERAAERALPSGLTRAGAFSGLPDAAAEEPGPEPTQESAPEPTQEPGPEPGHEPAPQPAEDLAEEEEHP